MFLALGGILVSLAFLITLAYRGHAVIFVAPLAALIAISADLMHRATAMASTGFDSLPHNGAVVTLLLVCGLTHRESYKDIAVVTIVAPVIGVVAVCALGLAFGSF